MLNANLILLNGKVYTFNPKKPKAQAIAVLGEKIIYVGENSEALKLIGPNTETVDLKGRVVLPGLIDCHVHMAGFGRSLSALDLRDVKSIRQLKELVEEKSKTLPVGAWIFGRGWDQEKFNEKRLPTRWDLDDAAPNNPVALIRVCGHICVVNTKALEKAGIDRYTEPPPGGKIDKDPSTGEPTGIIREKALDLIFKSFPKASEDEILNFCLKACQEAIKAGLTSVHWIIESPIEIRVIQRMHKNGKLPLRAYLFIPVEFLEHLEGLGLMQGFGDSMLKIGGVKILLDGSLGARTAALHKPYSDAPETRGMLIYSQEEVEKLFLKAHNAGLQLAVHAIGDKAIDIALRTFERILQRNPKVDHRYRMEHASVLNMELIQRMRRLGVIASVQPHFIVSDFWVEQRLGKARARWTYPFRTLLKERVVVCAGSDCPVEPISPLLGVWAAVVKQPILEEKLTVEEAFRLYTVNAAYASFEENLKGTIEEGKLADMVVLSEDPFEIEPEKIKEIDVLMTIVGGRIVYDKMRKV
ncbi:amidohydrolase [Candidatus Bathyarchaeota archaeon]|nr:MAG: amidohydrolase [Candidatus Bathyarchaeota archaeon]